MECLLVKGKNPSRKDADRFESALMTSLPKLFEFIERVKAENIEEMNKQVLPFQCGDGPSQKQIQERLTTLEKCVIKFSQKAGKNSAISIPELGEEGEEGEGGVDTDDLVAQVANSI